MGEARWHITGIYTNFTDLPEKAMGIDPANITNHVIIFLFIKALYNKDIRWWVSGAKTISTLADIFWLAHQSLFKLKKYEGLVYNDEHAIIEINEITDTMINIKVGNRPRNLDKNPQDKTDKKYPFLGKMLEV